MSDWHVCIICGCNCIDADYDAHLADPTHVARVVADTSGVPRYVFMLASAPSEPITQAGSQPLNLRALYKHYATAERACVAAQEASLLQYATMSAPTTRVHDPTDSDGSSDESTPSACDCVFCVRGDADSTW